MHGGKGEREAGETALQGSILVHDKSFASLGATCMHASVFSAVLCSHDSQQIPWQGSPVHRVVPGFVIEGGDIELGQGDGGRSHILFILCPLLIEVRWG